MALIKCKECGHLFLFIMRPKFFSLAMMLSAAFLLVQCTAKSDAEQENSDNPNTEVTGNTEITENADTTEKDTLPPKPLLTKVLTKKNVPHANDIVVLTPEFIKAVQKYEILGVFSEGLAAVKKKNGKWGYINTKGEEVIPAKIDTYYSVGRFSEGLAYVVDEDRSYGFRLIDTQGKTVFTSDEGEGYKFDCDHVDNPQLPYYIDGKLYVWNGDYAVYDNCGNKMESVNNDKGEEIIKKASAQNKYVVFHKEYKDGSWSYGVKDSKGRIVIPAQYDYVEGCYHYIDAPIKCQNGVFLVGFIDEHVNVDSPTYWGYVDLKGNDTFPENIKKRFRRH